MENLPPKAPKKIAGKEGPWQISVELDKENDLQAWIGAVMDAARIALSAAQTQKDVTDIFKVNRVIFDTLKAEAPEDHTAILADFKAKKDQFGESK